MSKVKTSAASAPIVEPANLPPEIISIVDQLEDETSELEFTNTDSLATAERSYGDRRMSDRIFDILKEQDLWEYKAIKISVGQTEIPLDFEHLGLSARTIERLTGNQTADSSRAKEKRRGSRSRKPVRPARMTIFPLLREAKDEMSGFRRKHIQEYMIYNDFTESWSATTDNLPLVIEGIQGLKKLHQQWRQKLISPEVYIPARREARLSIAGWLTSASDDLVALGEPPLDVQKLLREYDNSFPSPQELAAKLRLDIIGPDRCPSIASQVSDRADLAQSMAVLEQANLSRDQVAAAKRALEESLEAKREAVRRGAQYIEGRIIASVQELLAQADRNTKDPGKLTKERKARIDEALGEIQSLLKLPGAAALADWVGDSEELVQIANSTQKTRSELDGKIAELKNRLSQTIEFRQGKQGHRIA